MTDEAYLVAIDMQDVFSRADSGWFAPRYAQAASGIRELLPQFDDRTVFTRFVAPREPEGAWADYYQRWPFALVPDDDPLYALTPEFSRHGEAAICMTTFGKWGPALATAMRGSHEMVLTGVSTDCCVLSTALAAADAGVHVRVVADACAGISDRDHQRALDAMALFSPLIEITTVEHVRRDIAAITEE
jgi:nicotinamidase-related amidase